MKKIIFFYPGSKIMKKYFQGCAVNKYVNITSVFTIYEKIFEDTYYFDGESTTSGNLSVYWTAHWAGRPGKMYVFWKEASPFCTVPWNSTVSGRKKRQSLISV